MSWVAMAVVAMAPAGARAADLTAEQIAAKALDNNLLSTSNAQAEIELTVQKRGKVVRTRRIVSKVRRADGETRSLVEFRSPADVAGTKFLSVQTRGERSQQLMYLPAFKKVKQVVGAQRNRSFMGTDFSYADLEGREVEDATWKKLADADISGVSVYVVEGRPKDVGSEAYGKSVLYVHKAHLVPMRIDFFDKADPTTLAKQFKVRRLEKKDGRWIATDSVMSTEKKQTRTRLQLVKVDFTSELSDAELSRAALER